MALGQNSTDLFACVTTDYLLNCCIHADDKYEIIVISCLIEMCLQPGSIEVSDFYISL